MMRIAVSVTMSREMLCSRSHTFGLNPFYHRATYLTSASEISQTPPDEGYEVAFAGRSNAGKSSAINTLCQQKALARTSKTPGRTRLLNFFELDDERRLVDLPGYGYAKVPVAVKNQWQKSLAQYMEKRECLKTKPNLSSMNQALSHSN